MNKHLCCTLLLTLVGMTSAVYADSWSFPPTRSENTLEFGETKVVSTVDATEDRQWPEFTVRVLKDGELRGLYNGIAFDHLFASPDDSVFVGLSNDGLPGTAVVVFGVGGEIRFLLNHRHANLDYCDRSLTRVRVWYDAKNPDVKFRDSGTKESPSGVSLRNCRGEVVNLWETVARAYNTALEATQ